MKKLCIIPAALLLLNCGSIKTLPEAAESGYTVASCPENNACTLDIIKNKSLIIKEDGTGSLYYSTSDNPEINIIKYRYTKESNPQFQDSGYIEEVIFEIPANSKRLDYNDSTLQETKMLFSVMCFCRGKAGNYAVKEGSLTYDGDMLHIVLPDLVEGQKLHDIKVAFK